MFDDFNIEEEFDELDDVIRDLIGDVDNLESEEYTSTSIINPKRVRELLYAYKLLKHSIEAKGVKVTYALNTPYSSMGCVRVTGKNLLFDSSDWFLAAIRLATNFNAYAKTDGTTQLDFTFHHLTTPLD